jgi:3-hydroxyisobutyrate dehydrogenase-like beta-hydroxyacid dehydrogenase
MNGHPRGPRVGVIGLGSMGGALADRLIDEGHAVTVWNRTTAKATRFGPSGATVAESAVDAARSSDILIVCLSDHAATMDVARGRGFAETLKGKALVQLTTMAPEESRELAAWSGTHGIDYLEGQILDYPEDVRAGRSTMAFAGPRPAFERCRGILESLAGRGPLIAETVGAAAMLDKALFEIHFPAYVGFLHGAAMCRSVGVSIEAYADLVLAAYFRSGVVEHQIEDLAARVKAGSYRDDVKAAIETYRAAFAKTVRASESLRLETRHLRAIDAIFTTAVGAGYGEQDLAALFETMQGRGA